MGGEPFAFLIMPFDPEFDAVYDKLIVPALTDAGYTVGRADKTLDQRNILKDIIPNIARADLIVADITTTNANVFYELGVAHALRKPVVMIIQEVEEIPFDLRSYRVIPYATRFDEAGKLTEELQRIAGAHKEGKVTFENPVVDFIPELSQVATATAVPKEPRAAKLEPTPPAEEHAEEGEAGLIDFMADSERASAEYVEAMNELSEWTNALTESQTKLGEMLKAIEPNAPGSASRMQEVLKKMGLGMIVYGEKVDSLVESRLGSLERIIEAGEGLLSHPRTMTEENRGQIREVRPTLTKLQAVLGEGQQVLQNTRASVVQLGGYSGMLNLGVRRIDQAYDKLRNSILSAEARLARLINLIDERLGPEGAD
ncbi:MAG TPA: hypothetical protein VGR25_13745 [bacterium]|nr:hypothetical protein [bacterium]